MSAGRVVVAEAGGDASLSEPLVLPDLARLASQPNLSWTPLRPGVDIHVLYEEKDRGASAALLRYAPGASVPSHTHGGYEHIYVLSGSQIDARGVHHAGALVINPPGSRHSVVSPGGCLVLAIWERPVVFDH